MWSTQNKKGRISGYVKHIFYFTTFRITYNEHKEKFQIMSSNNNNNMNRITKRKNEQKRRKNEQKRRKNWALALGSAKKKRKLSNSGSNDNKRQRLSGYASEIIESEESEPSPEISAGETKESDSNRRGREKEEREQKKIEEAAERRMQRYAKMAASRTKPCIANIGGKRVEKNGIITFEEGIDFTFPSRPKAEEGTGILKCTIRNNISKKTKSRGKKGRFEGKQVMFINAPVDTSDKVPCKHCNKHYGSIGHMIQHVRAKHPGVLPPAAETIKMPEEYKTFTPPITQKQYSFIVNKVARNIQNDSLNHRVSEEDKIKLTEMKNRETYHKLAQQICVHMDAKGMFASENVTDDNGGLIKHGFEFESHGGLFALSFDRIEDDYAVNGQTFRKLHYPNLDDALENIRVVALMANVAYKATTAKIQERYDIYKNKSEKQCEEDIDVVLEISHKKYHNGKNTPLYNHANRTWRKDKQCKGAFATYQAYWQHMLVLLKEQEGLCAVAKIPMSLESGPWLMSCDAIDPRLGHVPRNLRLVCLYNNVTDHSKQNKDLTDTRPTSLTTELHNEYWRIVR